MATDTARTAIGALSCILIGQGTIIICTTADCRNIDLALGSLMSQLMPFGPSRRDSRDSLLDASLPELKDGWWHGINIVIAGTVFRSRQNRQRAEGFLHSSCYD